jgi:hypothetical protein
VRIRRAAVVVATLATITAVAGCNTSSLTKQELVVYFDDNAPQAEHVAALHACAHAAPEASPEPITTSQLPANQVGDVRFRVDHANDKDIALLTECLDKQPGVKGFDIPDLTD